MRCLMFPGQGVQRRGMGGELFDQFPELTAAADDVLGYSIKALCLDDENGRLRDTRFAQPAVFLVNALHARRMLTDEPGEYRFFVGHSLGEYNALVAAGHLELTTALALVRERAIAMSKVRGGGMAAVLGLPDAQVELVLRTCGLPRVFIANRNSHSQTVIAGDSAELAVACDRLKAAGARHITRLSVSGPFHTPLMAPAAKSFAATLRGYVFRDGDATVVSSATARPFDPRKAETVLSGQITGPVEWARTIRNLSAAGVTRFDEANGRTLTAMVEAILNENAASGATTVRPRETSMGGTR